MNAVDLFLQCVRRSGLVQPGQLREALESDQLQDVRSNPATLADHLVRAETLTQYQASKLLAGVWQGLVLGPYHVLAPLGRGGMGTVYLARDTKRNHLVALKILSPKRAREEARTLARFQREMEICRRVKHPHLTETYDAGVIQGVYYIAMQYVRGESLQRHVMNHGPLYVPRTARLFMEVADGLQSAHDLGLIHRDLKPSNIMVTPNGHAKILDLGLALSRGEETLDKSIIGGVGYVVGTMDYIAPEQVQDASKVDVRADLYSLGCTIYFALTGQPPFPGGTSIEKMLRHQREFPEHLTEMNPIVPREFAGIVDRLMAKRPEDRFSSARELREVLARWTAGDPELPLDVDPELDVQQQLREVERSHASDGDVWESIPVIAYANPSPTARDPLKDTDEVLDPLACASGDEALPDEPGSSTRLGWLEVVLLAGVVVGAGIGMLILEQFRRWA